MSRIGRKAISIPSGVSLQIQEQEITVKGPKGELVVSVPAKIKVEATDQEVSVERGAEDRQTRANHGLTRSLLSNAIAGVSEGFKKTLKLIGTGYRVAAKGKGLTLSVGFSHPIEVVAPDDITLQVEGNDTIHISGIDKQKVGQMAAVIRKNRPPEPYKGKGIRYEDEIIIKKQGKSGVK